MYFLVIPFTDFDLRLSIRIFSFSQYSIELVTDKSSFLKNNPNFPFLSISLLNAVSKARIAEKKDTIKNTNQTSTVKKLAKKEAEINSSENKDTAHKPDETTKVEANKENKKESK